jgi:8-oxo-dGTP pyrophosphatase MutT (NUDIX family)
MNEQQNRWTVLARKEVYANPWISVAHYDVLNPAGREGIYGKVHFKNIAIGIVPLDEDGNTWLVGQYRFVLNAYSWEIPEGGGPLGTDPLESAKRELAEETGLVAEEWTELQHLALSNSVTDEKGIIFLARNLHQGKAEPEDTEQLIVKKIPFAEAVRMVEQGEITDSVSVIAILRVQLLILQGKFKIEK